MTVTVAVPGFVLFSYRTSYPSAGTVSEPALTVTAAGGRVRLCQTGDTELNDRPADQIFDRFTRLENAEGVPGAGLGLWKVKEIVKAHNGRQSARVSGGVFTLEIDL